MKYLIDEKYSSVKLVKATIKDAETLWNMQKNAFSPLLEKYEDFDTNPGAETLNKIIDKLNQPYTYFYFIRYNNDTVGAIRIKDTKIPTEKKSIAPIFILPQYRRQGFAKTAIQQAEIIHGSTGWEINTILQETTLCHLYESVGYFKIDKQRIVSPKMTLVFYAK